eukprot:comp122526_c0_seq1/m.49018 comp122526_c0_seq1/g.49018  ORF comp122526_c0_seq1/g.49018 comp122526_c0_seq1/m.49018 type:complete len:209 (-) comp122526_c0_seq1:19-645(-)
MYLHIAAAVRGWVRISGNFCWQTQTAVILSRRYCSGTKPPGKTEEVTKHEDEKTQREQATGIEKTVEIEKEYGSNQVVEATPLPPPPTTSVLEALLNFSESEIREQFVRGHGPGGQHVNKTNNCVVLTHLPTGTTVRCHTSRSQSKNREEARVMLRKRLRQVYGIGDEKVTNEIDKIRRQKHSQKRKAAKRQTLLEMIEEHDKKVSPP